MAGVGNDHLDEGLRPGTHICWSVALVPTQLLPGEDGEGFRGGRKIEGDNRLTCEMCPHKDVHAVTDVKLIS